MKMVKCRSFKTNPDQLFASSWKSFMKTCEEENEVDVDRKAVDMWKNMSASDRQPYVIQAGKLNSSYVKDLLKEENDMIWVDDEADSAEIGNFDEDYEDCDPSENSEDCSGLWSDISESFDIFEGDTLNPWTFPESL